MNNKTTTATHTTQSEVGKYVRVKEAAEILHVSIHHVYRLVEKRLIPHYKSRGGKVIYFSLKDLEEYMTHTYVTPIAEVEQAVEKQLIKNAI